MYEWLGQFVSRHHPGRHCFNLVTAHDSYRLSFLMLKSTVCSTSGKSHSVLKSFAALIGCQNHAALVMKKKKILVAAVVRPLCSPVMRVIPTLCAVNQNIMEKY